MIGAGIGGLGTAALLSHRGKRVLVLDKNPLIGGACATTFEDGFGVDVGTHIFTRGAKGPLAEILRRTGSSDSIEFLSADPLIEYCVLGDRLTLRNDRRDLLRFYAELCKKLDVPWADALRAGRAALSAALLSERSLEELDRVPLSEYLDRVGDHPALRLWIAYLMTTFFVLSPREASTGESLWCLRQILRDFSIGYPRGGSIAIPEAYRRTLVKSGGELLLGAPVRRISVENARATGVELEDGRSFSAPAIVAALPLLRTIDLAGEKNFPAAFVAAARATRGSHYGVQLKIGLKKPLAAAGFLMGLLPRPSFDGRLSNATLDQIFDSVSRGELPPIHMFTAIVPTKFDPSLAPPGMELISAAMLAPSGHVALEGGEDLWIEELRRCVDAVLPGWRNHVAFERALTVRDIEAWGGRPGGGLISSAQTPANVGAARRTRSPIAGLFFAGDGFGSRGIGTELAAQSAIEAADEIFAASSASLELEDARRRCTEIVRDRGKNFYVASHLLPKEERQGLFAVYAFARLVDDLVDEPPPGTSEAEILTGLERALESMEASRAGRPPEGFWPALADAFQRWNLSPKYFYDLVAGVRRDLHPATYETFDELSEYFYGVAGTVGFLVGEILGHDDPFADRNVRSLASAFQLTNVLRDVREDFEQGRIYLPLEDLRRFGVSTVDLGARAASADVRRLIAFEVARAHLLFDQGATFARALRVGGASVGVGAAVYREHLQRIEEAGYDVLVERPSLSAARRIRTAAAAWIGNRAEQIIR